MLSRHTNELNLRLDRVANLGCSEVSGNELRRWYAQDRLSKTVWRDIHDKWQEIHPGAVLLIGKTHETYVMVFGGGIVIDRVNSTDPWLSDIVDWT
jgi:hypothetical protein